VFWACIHPSAFIPFIRGRFIQTGRKISITQHNHALLFPSGQPPNLARAGRWLADARQQVEAATRREQADTDAPQEQVIEMDNALGARSLPQFSPQIICIRNYLMAGLIQECLR
jgi:hypothetical protein